MSINTASLTFGTDAEVFVRTVAGDPFPITGLVGGTKTKPKPIESLGEGFFIQEDNAAAEFNTPPRQSFRKMLEDVNKALDAVRAMIPPSLVVTQASSLEIPTVFIDRLPMLSRFGCEPDYNAFTCTANEKPIPPTPGFRSAAAHIHIGWENPTDEDRLELIRLADVFATCGNLANENTDEIERRKLYGKAGAFRWKPYGCEHRVQGNGWLFNKYVFNALMSNYLLAVVALNQGIVVDSADYQTIQDTINEHRIHDGMALQSKYYHKLSAKSLQKYNEVHAQMQG